MCSRSNTQENPFHTRTAVLSHPRSAELVPSSKFIDQDQDLFSIADALTDKITPSLDTFDTFRAVPDILRKAGRKVIAAEKSRDWKARRLAAVEMENQEYVFVTFQLA